METATMGRVVTEATIANLDDLWEVDKGRLAPDRVRRLVVSDALVDTGATTLGLPKRFIDQLGLKKRYERRAITNAGPTNIAGYEAVRLFIQDRDWTGDVMEVPDEAPVIIGQIPLEMMDLVVDTRGRQLTGNPAHGGEHVLELFGATLC
jgi:predicted aspartyl protease